MLDDVSIVSVGKKIEEIRLSLSIAPWKGSDETVIPKRKAAFSAMHMYNYKAVGTIDLGKQRVKLPHGEFCFGQTIKRMNETDGSCAIILLSLMATFIFCKGIVHIFILGILLWAELFRSL